MEASFCREALSCQTIHPYPNPMPEALFTLRLGVSAVNFLTRAARS